MTMRKKPTAIKLILLFTASAVMLTLFELLDDNLKLFGERKVITNVSVQRTTVYKRFLKQESKYGLVENFICMKLDIPNRYSEPESDFYFSDEEIQEQENLSYYDFQYFPAIGDSALEFDARYRHEVSNFRKSIRDLIQNWMDFASELEIHSWISQGLLLALVVEKELSSWDRRLDFELSHKSFTKLLPHNQTLFRNRFQIDISPNVKIYDFIKVFEELRFIDITTGLFINVWQVAMWKMMFVTRKDLTYDFNDIMPINEIEMAGIKMYRPLSGINILNRFYTEEGFY